MQWNGQVYNLQNYSTNVWLFLHFYQRTFCHLHLSISLFTAFFFSFIGRTPSSGSSQFSLENIKKSTNMIDRLNVRKQCTYEEFTNALDLRALKYGKVKHFFQRAFGIFFYFCFFLHNTSMKGTINPHLSSMIHFIICYCSMSPEEIQFKKRTILFYIKYLYLYLHANHYYLTHV